jgi:hypothetical protein
VAVAFTLAALAGLVGGTGLGRRMHPADLKAAFGGMTLAVATYILVMNIGPLVGLVAHGG